MSMYIDKDTLEQLQLIDKIYMLHVFLKGLGVALESGSGEIIRDLASEIPQILKDTRPIKFSEKVDDT